MSQIIIINKYEIIFTSIYTYTHRNNGGILGISHRNKIRLQRIKEHKLQNKDDTQVDNNPTITYKLIMHRIKHQPIL
jgi:hypothetical protein